MISRLDLTGVTTAELRRGLTNMNMIEIIQPILLENQIFLKQKNERTGLQ